MGCGKNTVGSRLANKLGYEFYDMDKYIESREGKKISEIFASDGEAYFRKLETLACHELMKKENLVLACGGGTVLKQENVDALHNGGGKVFFLKVPVAALKERLKNDKVRPLLQVPNRNERIDQLYAERLPKYLLAADEVIDAGSPPGWVASRMYEEIASVPKK